MKDVAARIFRPELPRDEAAFDLRGQLEWQALSEAVEALVAVGEAVDADCARCELKCCDYSVEVVAEELEDIETRALELGHRAPSMFRERRRGDEAHTRALARRDDGTCWFFDAPTGDCKLHAAFGATAKPMACQAYPLQAVMTPSGARIGLRAECTRPGRSRRPEAVASFEALLRQRAGSRARYFVRRAPAQVRIVGDAAVPWRDYAAWEADAVAALREAASAAAGLDRAVALLEPRCGHAPAPAPARAGRLLAAGLAGVLDHAGEDRLAKGFLAAAAGRPATEGGAAPVALVAHAIESLDLLRFETVAAGLGVLRLLVAGADRVEGAADQPRATFAGLFRNLQRAAFRVPLAHARREVLEGLAVDPDL